MKLIVVAYDISDDQTRKRLFKVLKRRSRVSFHSSDSETRTHLSSAIVQEVSVPWHSRGSCAVGPTCSAERARCDD